MRRLRPKLPILTLPLALPLLLAACVPPQEIDPVQLFADNCAACHGVSGAGDGYAAAGLSRSPPDLTRIAHRNGGVFPTVRVMSQIDGYSRARDHAGQVMPEFGLVLTQGPMVPVETETGAMTQAPEPLVALTLYLRRLQRP